MKNYIPIQIENYGVRTSGKRKKSLLKRIFIILITAFIGFSIIMAGLLFFFQSKLIYHPKPYPFRENSPLNENLRMLKYQTSEGQQTSFYFSADKSHSPKNLWILFNGNGSLALDWLDIIENYKDKNSGFLLIEYPGYGFCKGKPSRRAIKESAEKALAVLNDSFSTTTLTKNQKPGAEENLSTKTLSMQPNINIIGFSIGTLTGADFAAGRNIKNIILAAPPTSLMDMAKITVGPVFCHLLLERYDTRARLKEFAAAKIKPAVYIFHGDADTVVPFKMGKELSEIDKKMIEFYPFKNNGHVDVLYSAKNEILRIVSNQSH